MKKTNVSSLATLAALEPPELVESRENPDFLVFPGRRDGLEFPEPLDFVESREETERMDTLDPME